MVTVAAAVIVMSAFVLRPSEVVDLTGHIGSHKVTLKAHPVESERTFRLYGPADYIAIIELYPESAAPVRYNYKLTLDDGEIFERSYSSPGTGKVTYYVRPQSRAVREVKITNIGRSGPVYISSIRAVAKTDLDRLLRNDRFLIMGLISAKSKKERDKLTSMLIVGIKARPEYGIGVGFSSEITYAASNPSSVESQIAECAQLARSYRVPCLLGLTSWWSGTPQFIDDGAGGRFGDVKYQQICYGPGREFAENPDLQKLLGERYNLHYKLSIPNQWSNCPWLTLNNDTLNSYRFRRLGESVQILNKICAGDTGWLAGVFLENEPRYWDTHCEAKFGETNPEPLWADFNPAAVEEARNDGVDLDPDDGLSDDELAWLHKNVGRYVQKTVDAYLDAARDAEFGANLPLYTHSLQLSWMFPGAAINRPASDWAYADGARVGLEGIWTMPADLYRVREWGRWANVNREENDGYSTDWHLWDLRVAYAMGADLYNSYNWHAIGPERFFAYVGEFLDGLPVAKAAPAQIRSLDRCGFRMKTPMKLQAFSAIELPLKVESALKGSAYVSILFPDGASILSDRRAIDLPVGNHKVAFEFTTPAECGWKDEAFVTFYPFDRRGRMACGRVGLDTGSTAINLHLDLRTQRALSLAAISRARRYVPAQVQQ